MSKVDYNNPPKELDRRLIRFIVRNINVLMEEKETKMKEYLVHAIYYMGLEYIDPPDMNIEEYIQKEFSEFTAIRNMGSTVEPETVEIEIYDILKAKDEKDLLKQIEHKFPYGLDTIFSFWEMVNQKNEEDCYN